MEPSEFKAHPFDWVVDRMRGEASYIEKPMFGCRACYLAGELKLVLAASGDEPWNGVLIATSKEHHESLLGEFPFLQAHPVLGKWLYVSEQNDYFDLGIGQITARILQSDRRIGVLPSTKPRRRKFGKKKARPKKKR